MPLIPAPPPLPEDASPAQREMHAQAVERFLTEGGQPLVPDDDEDATMAALRAMQRDHKRFLTHHSPVTASLQLAAMRTVEELQARATATETPAIVAMGEAVMRKAVAGDMAAVTMVTERFEGKAGNRKGDIDPEAENRRADMATIIESTVRALTEGKRGQTLEGQATEVED